MAKSCFISASADTLPHLEGLRSLLQQKGVQVTVPSDLKLGLAWPHLLLDTLRRVDFIIAVVMGETGNSNVYYEIGLARVREPEPSASIACTLERCLSKHDARQLALSRSWGAAPLAPSSEGQACLRRADPPVS
jgi:hypothetical protein